MKVLLTGATGYLGSEILAELVKQDGAFTVAWGRSPERLEALRRRFCADSSSARLEACDLSDAAILSVRPDVIVHAAALRPPGHSPAEMHRVNAEATRWIARLAERSGCQRLCYVSSQSVYGSLGAPWTEMSPLRPETAYAKSKLMGEREASRANIASVVILRMSRLYGVTPFVRWSEVLGQFAKAVVEARPLTIHGTGEQRFDLVHVRDAATAVAQVAVHPLLKGVHTFNLGGGESVCVNRLGEILSRLASELGLPPVTIQRTLANRESLRHLELDIARIRRELGWGPAIAIEEGMREYVTCLMEGRGANRGTSSEPGKGVVPLNRECPPYLSSQVEEWLDAGPMKGC